MKEEIVVKDLFRFSYGTIKLKENLKEMNKMAQVIKKKNRSVLLSNRGGYQSPNIEVDQIPGYKDFAIKVLRLAGKYSSIFTLNRPIKFLNAWLNINPYLTSNARHKHPHTIVSAVYYINVPKNGGQIMFSSPLDNLHGYLHEDDINTFNTFNSSARTLDPINNQLIFFPGWLAHEVTANFSKQKRISMAFNFG
mgnify:FL=1